MESDSRTITGSLITFTALILGDLGHFTHGLKLGADRACSVESKYTWEVFKLEEHGKVNHNAYPKLRTAIDHDELRSCFKRFGF